jgi:hypothetical protein
MFVRVNIFIAAMQMGMFSCGAMIDVLEYPMFDDEEPSNPVEMIKGNYLDVGQWNREMIACLSNEQWDHVLDLLNMLVDVDNPPDLAEIVVNKHRDTLLMYAVVSGRSDIVTTILAYIHPYMLRNYVARKNIEDYTALDYAAAHGCMDIYNLLLSYADEESARNARRCLKLHLPYDV